MIQSALVNCFPEMPLNEISSFSGEPECHVLYGSSDSINDDLLENLRSDLNEYERDRAEKFHFRNDRVNYIACRAITRRIAAKKINCSPGKVDIRTSVNDKPFIPGHPVYFNIAHSYNIFGVAFSENAPLGMDFEKMKDNFDFKSIISNYFSDNEQKTIRYAGEKALNRFFLYWTRKEALLKAMGLGITQDLTKIEILDGQNRVTVKDAGTTILKSYFIFSAMIESYYFSLALTSENGISFQKIDPENQFEDIYF